LSYQRSYVQPSLESVKRNESYIKPISFSMRVMWMSYSERGGYIQPNRGL